MKKLMIAAALTAMVSAAQAVTCVTGKVCEKDECTGEKVCVEVEGAGTAHKVVISLKTTANKGKVKAVKCADGECTYWRQQSTKKVNGLLWEQLDDCTGCVPYGVNSTFWTNDGAVDAEFGIGFGLIGNSVKSNKIEAYGMLSGEDFGTLSWAGFGTMASSVQKSKCEDDECISYIKSISGGIAGWLLPVDYENPCTECLPIEYEVCCEDLGVLEEKTAAYGTIKITYDAATAKKVAVADDDQDVASFFKLPKGVDADDLVVNEVVIEE